MKRILTLWALAAVLTAGGCGDDTVTPSNNMNLTINVTNSAGDPVPGAEVLVLMDSPYYQDAGLAKASVQLRWVQPIATRVRLAIEDVAGGRVRALYDDSSAAGPHAVIWDGRDEEGVHQASGVYYVTLEALDENGDVIASDREPMFMALMSFDRAQVNTTDADGKLVLRDKRLFPSLYGVEPMTARNENGEAIGSLEITGQTRIYVRDAAHTATWRFTRMIVTPDQTLDLVLTPVKPRDLETAAAPATPAIGPVKGASLPEPPTTFELDGPSPNPFN